MAAAYRFGPADRHCLGCALLHRAMLRNALAMAAVVGTILTAINHGDAIVQGTVGPGNLVKIALTYCVPFGVSVWSVLASRRERPPTA